MKRAGRIFAVSSPSPVKQPKEVKMRFGGVALAGVLVFCLAVPALSTDIETQDEDINTLNRQMVGVGSQLLPKPQVDGKIVGGAPAKISDYPYQLSLRYNGRHICGASIVSENYAITAAHCIISDKYPSKLTLRSGTSSLYTGGLRHRVDQITVHPSYTTFSEDFDVAVIKVKDPFKMSARASAIVLPEPGSEVEPGKPAVVTGWGVTREGSISPAFQLQYVAVPIVDNAECAMNYLGYGEITERMLCAGYKVGQKDACQGDSGGPLVADGVLVGVVSWGAGCARPGLPGVYTNLAEPGLREWISTVTGGL